MIISQEQYSKCIQIRYLSLIHGTMWQNAIFLSQKFNFVKFIHSEKATKIGRNLQVHLKLHRSVKKVWRFRYIFVAFSEYMICIQNHGKAKLLRQENMAIKDSRTSPHSLHGHKGLYIYCHLKKLLNFNNLTLNHAIKSVCKT